MCVCGGGGGGGRERPWGARGGTRHLNELELVRGEVLANVWHSDKVEDE